MGYGFDDQVKVLVQSVERPNDSTDFYDLKKHTVVSHNAIHSTAEAKFDTSSMKCYDLTAVEIEGSVGEFQILNWSEFTLDFWYNTSASNVGWFTYNGPFDAVGNNFDWGLRKGSNPSIRLYYYNAAGTSYLLNLTSGFYQGAWAHFTMAMKDSILYVWINGNLEFTYADLDLPARELYSSLCIGGKDNISYLANSYFEEYRLSNQYRMDNAEDPLYIASGIPADGFTPPIEAYSVGIIYDLSSKLDPNLQVKKPYYFLKGSTLEDGSGVGPRKVLLLERQNKQITNETDSDGTLGEFEFEYLEKSGLYTVLGLNDDPDTKDYNDICYGPIQAKIMETY